MEFRTGSPVDAEVIAGLIASFQSELTDDPSGAGAEEFLASVSLRAERKCLPQNATDTLSPTRILNLPGSSPSETVRIYFTCSSIGRINAKVLVGCCGSRHCERCVSEQRRSLHGQLKSVGSAGLS